MVILHLPPAPSAGVLAEIGQVVLGPQGADVELSEVTSETLIDALHAARKVGGAYILYIPTVAEASSLPGSLDGVLALLAWAGVQLYLGDLAYLWVGPESSPELRRRLSHASMQIGQRKARKRGAVVGRPRDPVTAAEVLAAVGETGSYAKAAAKLGITKSLVARRLKEAEQPEQHDPAKVPLRRVGGE